jgi:hypothetical protein
MVIAARGTDEAPPNSDWQNPSAYTSDQYKGAGQTLYKMYGQLVSANPKLKISLYPVGYPTSLRSGQNGLLALARQTADYLNDADIGADGIVEDIQSTDIACGSTVSYILAGYSLGAWAVHDALNQLTTQNKLGEIAGVALFGDPKFQPGQPFVRDFQSQDTYHGVAYYTIEQADNAIPPAVVPKTGSWCLPADPICQFQYNHLNDWARELGYCVRGVGACAHFQYWTSGETLNAARFLSPLLSATSHLTGTPPSDGTVGDPYTWTATAGPASTYTWTSTGTLPPGLSFDAGGTLSGTPTQAGTYTFSVTATDIYGRFVAGSVTVTIHAQPGPPPPSWGNAEEVPGMASLNVGGARLLSLSCPSAGNCSAGGSYSDGSFQDQAFVVDEVNGIWGNAVEVPGSGALNAGGFAGVQSLSCASAGNCSAGGSYDDSSGYPQVFVVSES